MPQKIGEIGFQEGVHVEVERPTDDNVESLPPRHPADRGNTPPPPPGDPESSSSQRDAPPRPQSPSTRSETSSLHKSFGSGSFLLSPRLYMRRKKIGGVRLSTVCRLILQILLLCGTIAAWVLLALKMKNDLSQPVNQAPQSQNSNPQNSSGPSAFSSASVFIHITFAFTTLAQLIFLERCIFLVRAPRYAYKHPGQVLPRHGRNFSNSSLQLSLRISV